MQDTNQAKKRLLGKDIVLYGHAQDEYLKWLTDTPGIPEEDIISLIRESVNEQGTIIDIGANIGYISIASSLMFPKVTIEAFEPSKKTYSILRTNLSENHIRNVRTHNYGISDRESSSLLTYSESNSSGAFVNEHNVTADTAGHVTEHIKLKTLDKEYKNLKITKCDLIKIDVEGHELSVIKGSKELIKKFKPMVILEANHWCLNVFARTSLPDFVEELFKTFEHIYAFADGDYLDLSDKSSRYLFYYENTVNNKFMNLYCGFNKKQLITNLEKALYQQGRIKELQSQNDNLVEKLEITQELLAESLSKNVTLQRRVARKIRQSVRRLE
jgi:FkbM family methyltransferase